MSIRWRSLASPAIALLALLSSAIGIVNQFTYDDKYVILLNPAAHNLHQWWRVFASSYWPKDWGGDGYRPLTILAFKIESVIGGGSPMTFHATNILLYAVTSVLVFALARRMLPLWAAWITAALFAVHPVHVEAVANVVGQSELLVAIALLSATIIYIRARASGDPSLGSTAGIAVLYALACFSKEHGIVLPAILIAAELTIIDDARPIRERVEQLRPMYLLLTAIAVGFVGVRTIVLADHGIGGFQPFVPFATLHISGPDRILTAFGVVPQWVRLLYWPAQLSSEYGPPAIEIAQGLSLSQLPGFLLLLGILALGLLLRRRERAISFGIALVCIALLPSSNFIVPAGIILAERTLFLPSAGAMLIVGALAVIGREKIRARRDERRLMAYAQLALSVLLVVGVAKSAKRSTVWRDNDTLFRRAVVDAPLSYRAHYMLGAWHFENKQIRDGELEYRKALHLFPYDPFLSYNMAEQYRRFGMCGPALPLYRWTNNIDPKFPLGHTSFAMCLLDQGDFDEAHAAALEGFRFGGDATVLRRIIFVTDSVRKAARHGKVT
jgi:tetratricopeptide (TPR) repeat protein